MRAIIPRCDLVALERAWRLPPSPPPTAAQVQLTLEATNDDAAAPPNLDHIALAPRELHVLRLMAHEGSYSDIAGELGLQPETVKGYAKAVRRKLGASSREEAVARARAAGLMH